MSGRVALNRIGSGRYGLSGFGLKIIAILAMLLDHIGASLYPSSIWLRAVGRLAFPIFAFLICEGFIYTRSVKRYAMRLGVFAIFSEIPYNLLHSDHFFDLGAQNIFLTLLIGLLTIFGIHWFRYDNGEPTERAAGADTAVGSVNAAGEASAATPRPPPRSSEIPRRPIQWMVIFAGIVLAELLRTDYGAFGVMIIIMFYILRDRRGTAALCLIAANIAFGLLSFIYGNLPLQALAGLAAAPLLLYNGKKGHSVKYLFYTFYPVHIAVLMAIKYFVFNLPLMLFKM